MDDPRREGDPTAPRPGTDPVDPAGWLLEHGDALYRYAASRVGRRELAEDLVQEALVAALGARRRFDGRSAVRTWLIAILRRKIADHYRARPPGPPRPNPRPIGARSVSDTSPTPAHWREPVCPLPTPAEAAESREFREALERCLAALPESLAVPFAMRELDGLEVAAIAEALGISRVNLRVRLHRARLVLRDCLTRRRPDDRTESGGGR